MEVSVGISVQLAPLALPLVLVKAVAPIAVGTIRLPAQCAGLL